jgi:thiol-disulfide isomerase/thioredoxin
MRTLAATALLLLLLLLLAAPTLAADERTRLLGLEGGQLTGDDLAAGPVIVVVWASWSPRCRDVVPRMNALESAFSARARVVSVVFQEEGDAVRRFLGAEELRVPVYLDLTGSFSKRQAVSTVPWLLIFVGGRVAWSGKLPAEASPVVERALEP